MHAHMECKLEEKDPMNAEVLLMQSKKKKKKNSPTALQSEALT